MSLSENLKRIRISKGLTQRDVAALLGCSVQSYAQYESGKRKPKIETLARFANALDISIADLSPDLLDSEELQSFFALNQQLSETVQKNLYEAQQELSEQLADKADGAAPSYQTIVAWALALVPQIAKKYSLPPELLRRQMWSVIDDLLPVREDDKLYKQALDLLHTMTQDGKRAAVHHLQELAQIPAYQANPQPAGENQAETSVQAPAGDGQSGEK